MRGVRDLAVKLVTHRVLQVWRDAERRRGASCRIRRLRRRLHKGRQGGRYVRIEVARSKPVVTAAGRCEVREVSLEKELGGRVDHGRTEEIRGRRCRIDALSAQRDVATDLQLDLEVWRLEFLHVE